MVYNWLIDPLTNGLLEVCGELGILVLAYCKDSTPISQELTWSLTQKSSTPRTRFPRRQDQACRGSSREWHACQDPPTLARRQLPQECPASWWYRSPCKEEGMHSEPDRHQLALITLVARGCLRSCPSLALPSPTVSERTRQSSILQTRTCAISTGYLHLLRLPVTDILLNTWNTSVLRNKYCRIGLWCRLEATDRVVLAVYFVNQLNTIVSTC